MLRSRAEKALFYAAAGRGFAGGQGVYTFSLKTALQLRNKIYRKGVMKMPVFRVERIRAIPL